MGSRREQRNGLALFLVVVVLCIALAVSLSSGQFSSARFDAQTPIPQDVVEPDDDAITPSQAFTLADVNDDGFADLIAINTLGVRVLVHLSRGDGTFENPIELTPTIDDVDVDPSCVAVGDVGSAFDTGDGPEPDGNVDIVVGTIDGEVVILVGDGEGNFEVRPEDVIETDLTDSMAIALEDFNDDGDLDIALLGSFDEAVVLLGEGGNFNPEAEFFATDADTAIDMAVGDIDDDGEFDLVVLDQENQTVSLLLGLGDGTFEDPETFSTISDQDEPDALPMGLAVADLDEDGADDVVVINSGTFASQFLLVLKGPDLNDDSNYGAPANATGVVLGDFDGNGILDALVSHSTNAGPTFIPDDGGAGGFLDTGGFSFSGFGTGLGVAAGDFGGDDLADFVELNREGKTFLVGINVSNEPTPTGGTPPPGNTPTPGPSGTPTATVPTNTPTPTATATPIPTFPLSRCEIPINGLSSPARPVDVDWGLFDDNQFNDIAVADRNGRVLLFLINREMPFPEDSQCIVDMDMGSAASNLTLRSFDVSNGTPAALAVGPLVGGVTATTGRHDVAVVGGRFLTVFYGDGQGGLQEQLSRDLGGDLRSVVVADINRDNNNDIVVADRGGNTLRLLYGNGGTFNDVVPVTPGPGPVGPETPTPAPTRTPGPPSFVLAARFDSDIYLDLAEASEDGRTVAVRFQDSQNPGQFRSVTTVGSEQLGSGNPTALVAGNFNEDSVLDLAVTMTTGTPPDQIVILIGVESGGQITYQRLSNVATDADPTDIGVGNFSAMGGTPLQHLVATNIGDNTVSFYEVEPGMPINRLNSADLGEMDGNDLDGMGPAALTIADFDGDSDPDVVVANRDSGTLSLFRSQVAPATPTPLPTSTPTPTGTVTQTGTITGSPTQSGTPTQTPTGSRTATETRTVTATPSKSPKLGAFGLSDGGCGIAEPTAADFGGLALLWAAGVFLGLRRDFVGQSKRGGS